MSRRRLRGDVLVPLLRTVHLPSGIRRNRPEEKCREIGGTYLEITRLHEVRPKELSVLILISLRRFLRFATRGQAIGTYVTPYRSAIPPLMIVTTSSIADEDFDEDAGIYSCAHIEFQFFSEGLVKFGPATKASDFDEDVQCIQ